MWEWLSDLFATDGFPARWNCGSWPAWLGWLHIVSDLVTFAAYVAIPIVLGLFLWRRQDLPVPRVAWLFVAFVFTCGTVHLFEAVIFWWPVYPWSGVLKALTAIISILTVLALVPTMRAALRIPAFSEATARLAAIISASSDAIVSKDLDGHITSWNDGATRLYGLTADEMVGKHVTALVPDDLHQQAIDYTRRVRNGERIAPFTTERLHKHGYRIPVSVSLSPVFGRNGTVVGISGITRDIRDQLAHEQELERAALRLKRANRRLRELADRDPLTGLLNRRGFEDALAVEVERIRRYGTSAAVILIDVDDFKDINERHGHDTGDAALREIGDRLDDAARETDLVGRIGGDEFMVLAPETRIGGAMRLAQRLREAIAASTMDVASPPLQVSVSCGVETVTPERSQLKDLLGDASNALSVAKSMGKNTVCSSRTQQEPDEPDALELRALTQPIVELATGREVACELLIRGPRGPLESPDRLFALHRERKTLTAMDLACLDRCIDTIRARGDNAPTHVNVFPSTLLEADIDEIAQRLSRGGTGCQVCIELNESMLVGDPKQLIERVKVLRDRVGCQVALDDVGYGRSSIEALIVLEPDTIKIDRRYVHGVADDPAMRRHLERLILAARALDARIIAEGLERGEDRDVLQELGVEFAQGYLFGRPAARN
ncbi:MAG: diguanylate cyclase [Planctomycetota bacterium]